MGSVGTIVLHGLVPIIWFDVPTAATGDLPEPPWLIQLLGGLHPLAVWSVVAGALLAGLLLVLAWADGSRRSSRCRLSCLERHQRANRRQR